jgi:hypothetical protein
VLDREASSGESQPRERGEIGRLLASAEGYIVLDDVWFAEDPLERAGPNPTLKERRESIWQDNVDLTFVTKVIYDDPGKDEQGFLPETEEDREVERIAESAEAALRALVTCKEVGWRGPPPVR